MKKRAIWIVSSLCVLVLIVLIGAGSYFYDVAINRSDEDIKLHGSDSEMIAVSAMEQDLEQLKLEEVMEWTDQQKFETLELESEDGLKLKAAFLKNEKPNGKAVILAHGYKGNKEQMPGITKFYYEQGFDVLKPDARGHGESEGDYIGYGWHERKDYQQWVQLLVDEQNSDSIILHGFSMGAATVLMTSGEELPPEVKGVVADSSYTSVDEELTHQLKHMYHLPAFPLIEVTSVMTKIRAGYSFGEASALEQVKFNKLPLFIIHGDQDDLVPTSMANVLYEAATSVKDLWIVPGAGHTDAFTIAEEEYKDRLLKFFEVALDKE